MESDTTILLIEIIITMAFSAFFSGLEIAFVSSNKLRFEVDQRKGLTSKIIALFYHNYNNFISTMLVGNNIVLVIYGILMTTMITRLFALAGLTIENEALLLFVQTLVSTIVILFTGEYLPKTLFKINPNNTLRFFAIPAFICYVILYPISKFASALSRIILRVMGRRTENTNDDGQFTKVDLDHLIQSTIDNTDKDDENSDELKIFQNALDFSDTRLRDCLVPRTEIEAVSLDCPYSELVNHFIESGKTKIIVYKENLDDIAGYIHSSELFRHRDDWNKYIREIPIVPETMTAQKMLSIFLQRKKSIAIVVDEFGGTSGIVTIEDLFEEIFGDIQDEHDTSNYVAKAIGEKEYLLSARLEIDRVNELFDLRLPESDSYLTVGGLILNHYQSFPKLNEEITIHNLHFKILKLSATKIELVKLRIEGENKE